MIRHEWDALATWKLSGLNARRFPLAPPTSRLGGGEVVADWFNSPTSEKIRARNHHR